MRHEGLSADSGRERWPKAQYPCGFQRSNRRPIRAHDLRASFWADPEKFLIKQSASAKRESYER